MIIQLLIRFQSLWSLCWFVMSYDLNQDETVYDQEKQSSKPDEQERVVAFKLQEVGWDQPTSLE